MFSLQAKNNVEKVNSSQTVDEIWAEVTAKYGIAEMSDEELESLLQKCMSDDIFDERIQPISAQIRIRANARDTRTDAEKFIDADPSIWH